MNQKPGSQHRFTAMAGEVLLLNFSAKNPPLRQAAKRYRKTKTDENEKIVQ